MPGKVRYDKINFVEKTDWLGTVKVVIGRRGSLGIYDDDDRQIKKYDIPYGAELLVPDEAAIKKGQPLYNHDPYNAVILTDTKSKVSFVDLIDKVTMEQIADKQTGHVQKVVIESKDKTLTPSIVITTDYGEQKVFNLPTKT
mgnify:CR=1 FL=1